MKRIQFLSGLGVMLNQQGPGISTMDPGPDPEPPPALTSTDPMKITKEMAFINRNRKGGRTGPPTVSVATGDKLVALTSKEKIPDYVGMSYDALMAFWANIVGKVQRLNYLIGREADPGRKATYTLERDNFVTWIPLIGAEITRRENIEKARLQLLKDTNDATVAQAAKDALEEEARKRAKKLLDEDKDGGTGQDYQPLVEEEEGIPKWAWYVGGGIAVLGLASVLLTGKKSTP